MPVTGKNIPHDSARGHVTGESLYIEDIPPVKNELVVDCFWSPVSHGRIVSIETADALSVPRIAGIWTWRDLPHNLFGPILKDEILLAEEVCTFMGQPVVVIAGETLEAVHAARALLRVTIEELPPILTIEEALARGEIIGETRVIRRGDVDEALAGADHVIEGVFVTAGQDHFYLESQAAVVYPGEHDALTVHSSTQNPTEVQEVIAHLLGLSMNQVVVVTKRMGGAFGGKECQATHPAAIAALVAHKTKRAARIVFTKDDDMQVTGKRHPFRNRYRAGFDGDGRIRGLRVDLVSDGGAYADLSPAVMGRAMTHSDNAYYIPAVEITGTVCRTNMPPNTAFRGFGGPQGVATIENIIEEIAAFLKKDALDVRLANCYGIDDRNITPYGQIVRNNTLPRLFAELVETSDYRERMRAVRDFNESSATHLRGLSLTAVKFGISFNTKFLNQASALVNIFIDGTVQVSTGATEMGQGVNTKIRQLVADELGTGVSDVIVMITSTEKNNNSSASAASSAADLNGSAAVDACRRLRERLASVAATQLAPLGEEVDATRERIVFEDGSVFDSQRPETRLAFRDLVKLAYHQRVSLGERGFYATQGIDWDWPSGSGNPFLYYTNGCAASEVLIDRFTGEMKVLRSDVLMDIGRPINPGIDRGQMTGAFVQGMGWVTTEELKYSERGELLSHSPTTYKIPGIHDLPEIFNVGWIDNDNVVNLRGSKATGEPPLLLAISVWCAAKHALSFVSNGSIPQLRLPATNEELAMRIAAYAEQSRAVPPS
ncbi:MAG TPA: xanthine dehydrogenase molybdopterin binding subunit [Thermoanaerobaculia bacterium]|nr:xanthine dehydrogenase molybdopterin binding subunit [Thermoanaerobaculia bacterium]